MINSDQEPKGKVTVIKEELKKREAALVEAEKRLHSSREEVNKKHREFLENSMDYPLWVRERRTNF